MIARMRETNDRAYLLKQLGKGLLIIAISVFAILYLTGCKAYSVGMLNPKGVVAYQERKLFFDTLALMLIVVLPVIIMSFAFVYHYQLSHQIRDYKPNWSHSYFLESIWWGIPCAIILVLGILTWKKTHLLDPYARIPGHENQTPLLIQAIALPWKWLFIYPEQGIATINYLEMPVDQPVEFWTTTDNVAMSAFFIPQLGSQIYAMAGMRTRLHLLANEIGVYEGLNTQYNGDGFSDMHFTVNVVDSQALEAWMTQMKKSPPLTQAAYEQLLVPTINQAPAYFSAANPKLFENIINLYIQTIGTTHPRANVVKLEKE